MKMASRTVICSSVKPEVSIRRRRDVIENDLWARHFDIGETRGRGEEANWEAARNAILIFFAIVNEMGGEMEMNVYDFHRKEMIVADVAEMYLALVRDIALPDEPFICRK